MTITCSHCNVEKDDEFFKDGNDYVKFKMCSLCRDKNRIIQMCEHGKFKSCCYDCIHPAKLRLRKICVSTKQSDKIYNRYDSVNHIDYEHLKELLFESMYKCAHCKGQMQLSTFNDNLCTIDRLDDSIGHIKGNCVLACRKCNYTKPKKKNIPI